ncbi:relaxase/mobilization nuclease domain-containing protein [Metabacillus fastidiosus]|uniref:relaxase/mobilization nuclease domain-containing protein n=1 Tax=Metabacillus fastidiosus TaxID=1458 RepID=UPI003D2CA31F
MAENHFKGKHQYVVITHTEIDNLHNHIIFNSINFQDLKSTVKVSSQFPLFHRKSIIRLLVAI